MKSNFFELYDALLSCTPEEKVLSTGSGEFWGMSETAKSTGIAMTFPYDSMEKMFPDGMVGLSTREAAQAAKSWNFREAALGMAAMNSVFNTPERLEKLNCYEPFENYCTRGIDFNGKTVGLIGHMHGPEGMREAAKEVYIIERKPKPGDYPDSACDYLLPKCDIVLITGSTLVNKTLPHLLELCENAITILTGPTVPMCPALLDFGIDRIAGLVIDDRDKLRRRVNESIPGTPYFEGRPFLLMK